MAQTHHVEFPGKERGTAESCLATVRRMVFEEVAFIVKGGANGLIRLDIPLTPVHDGNITKSQGNNSSGQDINDIRAFVPVFEVMIFPKPNSKTRLT